MKRGGTHLPSIERLTALIDAAANGRLYAVDPPPTNDEDDLVRALGRLVAHQIWEASRDHSED